MFGWKKDPSDSRDKPFGMVGMAAALPPEASLRPFVVKVLDQLDTESCVANAVAQAVRTALNYRGESDPLTSRLFLYFNARAWTGDQTVDMGTYIRTCIKGLARFGAPAEEDWPFYAEHVNNQPPWNAYRLGYDFRGLRGYYRIFDDEDVLNQIRGAIASGRPVVAGWRVDESILDPSGGIIDVQTGDIVGGHAMAIVGYDVNGNFEIVNSWGSSWRDNGFAKCTPDFILQGSDQWIIDPQ